MAKRLPPEEMVKITLDTSTMQDIDPETKLPLGTFKFILKDLEKDLGTFERALQSSTNYFEFFSNSLKKIDKDSGLAQQSFFIRKSEFDNAKTALIQTNQKVATPRRSKLGYNISAEEAELVTGKRTLHGKYAQKKAMEELERLGGTMTADPKHKDKFDISIPFAKSELEGLSDKERSSLITQAMPNARKLSSIENRKISAEKKKKEQQALEQEEARKKKEEEKAQAEQARNKKKRETEQKKAQQALEQEEARKKKEEEKAQAEQARNKKKREAEQARNKKKRETEQKKAQQALAHKRLTIAKAVFASLVILTDIARRILSSMFKQAQQNNESAVQAHSVGMTLMQKHNLDNFDVAHGLEAGDSFRAIQVIQQKWGDVTNLDEEGLGVLARVMGGKVGDFVNSGMGGKNPDKLFDMILDDFFKQYLDGKNSLGQEVGRAQARRELTTVLAGVSPEIAKVFERMIDDLESGYYKNFKNATEWRQTTATLTDTRVSDPELKYSTQLGKVYNEILAQFKSFKEDFLTQLLFECNGLLFKIKNWRIGDTATTNISKDEENRARSEKDLRYTQTWSKGIETSGAITEKFAQKLYRLNQAKYSSMPINIPSSEFLELATGKVTEKDLIAKYEKDPAMQKSMLNKYGIKSKAQLGLIPTRAKQIFRDLLLDADIQDELAFYQALYNLQKELKENIDTPVGARVKEIMVTPEKITVEAQKLIESVAKDESMRKENYGKSGSGHDRMVSAIMAYFLNKYNKDKLKEANNRIAKSSSTEATVLRGLITEGTGFYDPNFRKTYDSFKTQEEKDAYKIAKVLIAQAEQGGTTLKDVLRPYAGSETFIQKEFSDQSKQNVSDSSARVLEILSKLSLKAGKTGIEFEQRDNTLRVVITGANKQTKEIPDMQWKGAKTWTSYVTAEGNVIDLKPNENASQ